MPGFGHLVQSCAHDELNPKDGVQKNLTNQIITNFSKTVFFGTVLAFSSKENNDKLFWLRKVGFDPNNQTQYFDSLFYDDYILNLYNRPYKINESNNDIN